MGTIYDDMRAIGSLMEADEGRTRAIGGQMMAHAGELWLSMRYLRPDKVLWEPYEQIAQIDGHQKSSSEG